MDGAWIEIQYLWVRWLEGMTRSGGRRPVKAEEKRETKEMEMAELARDGRIRPQGPWRGRPSSENGCSGCLVRGSSRRFSMYLAHPASTAVAGAKVLTHETRTVLTNSKEAFAQEGNDADS